jgi:hypothetical protein
MMVGIAVAGEPTFASINWDDGDDTVIAKIGKIKGFSGVLPLAKKDAEPYRICRPDIRTAKAAGIKPTALNNSDKTADSNIDTRVVNSGDAAHQINSIDFSRSKITDKLLVINVSFNKNRDSFTRDLGDTIDLMLKKHGLPSRIIRDTYQWKISNVEIDADGSSGVISYHHLINIEEHCNLESQKTTRR